MVYHSLVYDFRVGPTNIYVLATPMVVATRFKTGKLTIQPLYHDGFQH